MTKREQILLRLLRETWEALPMVLQDDCSDEIDWEALCGLADSVRAALGNEPMRITTYEIDVPPESRAKKADDEVTS